MVVNTCKKIGVLLNSLLNLFKNTRVNQEYMANEDYALIEDLRAARNEWLNADSNFQFVYENEIVDYYTYMAKAAQAKYRYCLKKAKERGLKSWIEYR